MEDSHGFAKGTMTSWMCQQVHAGAFGNPFHPQLGHHDLGN